MGVETLEPVPQNFTRRFHFFNLVSEILVSEIFQNTGFNYWYYRTDFFYSFGKKTLKSTFTLRKLKMITIFTLMNSFICFFLKTS